MCACLFIALFNPWGFHVDRELSSSQFNRCTYIKLTYAMEQSTRFKNNCSENNNNHSDDDETKKKKL